MKKTVLIVASCFIGSLAFSQSNDGPKLLAKLDKVCQLAPEQKAKLQPMVENHVRSLQSDKQKFAGEELKKADDVENVKFEKQLSNVLNSSQMTAYKNNQ